MQQFHGARYVLITGGSFRQIQGNCYDGGRDVGLHILSHHIAAAAIYNSCERYPPPKCHTGTRERIINTILDWINDPSPKERAFWLYGPAGAGKSAIAHSIAVLLQDISEDSRYAASFFFARDEIGRGEGSKLFSTLAYQLALKFPSFRSQIDDAMLDNPTLPTKSTDIQLRYLIIEPLLRVPDWPTLTPTIIIDGLDECGGSKRVQSEILLLLSKAIIEHNIPLRFLIASRPEYWIADSFDIGPFTGIARSICLRDDEDTDKDIAKVLHEGFKRIYDDNIRIMASVPRPWPSERVIKRFVRESSGQYVYPSTVLKFVGDSSDFCDPREQLRILMTSGPHRASAFSDLDKLYATILSAYPRLETMKRVLGGLLLSLSKNTIQEFLAVEAGEIQLVLSALSSLIKISTAKYSDAFHELEPTFGSPLVEPPISLCHLSFREFLENESRSGKYAIDKTVIGDQIICSIFKLGTDILKDSPEAEQTISRMGLSDFRRMLWSLEYVEFTRYSPAVMKSFQDLYDTLRKSFVGQISRTSHASHVYWFTSAVLHFLNTLQPMWQEENNRVHIEHVVLIGFLRNFLDVYRVASAKHILDITLKNTPTFTFLASYSRDIHAVERHDFEHILEVMAISLRDIISDLKHLHHVIYLDFDDSASYLQICTVDVLFPVELYKIYRCHEERHFLTVWNHRRISFSSWAFSNLANHEDRPLGKYYDNFVHIVDSFLQYSRLSDIHSEEFFEDSNKMAIFNIIMDSSFWDGLHDKATIRLALGALGWFTRQMSGDRKCIIEQHDNCLPQIMERVMRRIFQNAYLPHFTTPYCSNLWIYSDHGSDIPSIYLDLVPSHNDGKYFLFEEKIIDEADLPIVGFSARNFYGYTDEFHRDVFEKEGSSVIHRSDWYPHLSAFLLTMLVKNQYAALKDEFEVTSGWSDISGRCFLPLIVSLPYAYPTQHNLSALRALHYLWSRIDPRRQWRRPIGFCTVVIDFLKKYNRSSLSCPEYEFLREWLLGLAAQESGPRDVASTGP